MARGLFDSNGRLIGYRPGDARVQAEMIRLLEARLGTDIVRRMSESADEFHQVVKEFAAARRLP